MLSRPSFPKQKNVLVICDTPHKTELENGEPYSSASNLNLLSSLRTGRVFTWSKVIANHKGVNPLDIRGTYLDYDYFGQSAIEKNFDFAQEIKKKKDLSYDEDGNLISHVDLQQYFLIPHQKDCYVSERLWNCLQGLLAEIRTTQPKLIVLTGKWSLFFLTGMVTYAQTAGNPKDRKPLGGLVKFRSSIMKIHESWGEFEHNPIVVPIYHPSNAVGMPDKVPIMEVDIQRLGHRYHTILEKGTSYYNQPDRNLIIGTSIEIIENYFNKLFSLLKSQEVIISCDIETMFSSVLDCIGFAYSQTEAICIPFALKNKPSAWNIEEEAKILALLHKLFHNKKANFVLQNGAYDAQFIYLLWGIRLKMAFDTMIMSHILYNYLPKSLDFLASIHCDQFTYWKNMQQHGKEG